MKVLNKFTRVKQVQFYLTAYQFLKVIIIKMRTLISFLAFLAISAMHPHHVSVFEFKHNESESKLELSCKIFIEDLEPALKKETNELIDLIKDYKTDKVKDVVNAYLTKHLSVNINEKAAQLNFVGLEPDGESLWCYYEVSHIKEIEKFAIKNTVLLDYKEDQTNLIHLKYKKEIKSLKLNIRKNSGEIKF